MIELGDGFESLDEVEALVRSAQDYVCPSDELRPRILEAARSEIREQRVLDCLRSVAVCLVALGMLLGALRQTLQTADARQRGVLAWIMFNDVLATETSTVPVNDASWGNVESFLDLRRRQAEILRFAR